KPGGMESRQEGHRRGSQSEGTTGLGIATHKKRHDQEAQRSTRPPIPAREQWRNRCKLVSNRARQIVDPVQAGESLAGKDSSPAFCAASSASLAGAGGVRGGGVPPIWGRGSAGQAGGMSLVPRVSALSSAVKPGASVPISKRMPPGSRKSIERKYL